MYDRDRSGFIDPQDLHEIATALNKDPQLVIDTIKNLDTALSQDQDRFSVDEFIRIMSGLDHRDSRYSPQSLMHVNRYQVLMKKEFGNMLPRGGIYFVPDFKVIDFIK